MLVRLSLLIVYFAAMSFTEAASAPQYLLKAWGSEGSGPGEFNEPWGITADQTGFVYVADTKNHRVQKFTADGEFVLQWGKFGSEDGDFNEPWDLELDGDGNVFVVDRFNHRVQKFTENGDFLGKWGSPGPADGQFQQPFSIAVDADGFVYIGDNGNRIQKFNNDGELVLLWGSWGTGEGQFQGPTGLASHPNTKLYVIDSSNIRIQVFSSDGVYLDGWHGFKLSIDVGPDGFVYLSDSTFISMWNPNGTYVTNWRIAPGIALGKGITVTRTSEGVVAYAIDHYDHTVKKFVEGPTPVNSTTWGSVKQKYQTPSN